MEEEITKETEEMQESRENQLHEILLNTQEQCQMMEQMIRKQIEVKDQLIDRLHTELEYYKQDAADKFVDQLMKAVIKVRKDMKLRMQSDKWKMMSGEELRREYQYIFEDLTDLLEQQNVDEYESEPGDEFEPMIHQARAEMTQEKELDRKIKQSLSAGYKRNGKVMIAERVAVYQYTTQ